VNNPASPARFSFFVGIAVEVARVVVFLVVEVTCDIGIY